MLTELQQRLSKHDQHKFNADLSAARQLYPKFDQYGQGLLSMKLSCELMYMVYHNQPQYRLSIADNTCLAKDLVASLRKL